MTMVMVVQINWAIKLCKSTTSSMRFAWSYYIFTMTVKKPYLCSICRDGKSFVSYKAASAHGNDKHSHPGFFLCSDEKCRYAINELRSKIDHKCVKIEQVAVKGADVKQRRKGADVKQRRKGADVKQRRKDLSRY